MTTRDDERDRDVAADTAGPEPDGAVGPALPDGHGGAAGHVDRAIQAIESFSRLPASWI